MQRRKPQPTELSMGSLGDQFSEEDLDGLGSGALDFNLGAAAGAAAESDPGAESMDDIESALRAVTSELDHLSELRANTFRDLQREVIRYRAVLRGALHALAEAVDAKDTYTHGHSRRVSAYASHLGRVIGLTPEELDTLTFGALLHDVGKIGMPESILRKPARLTTAEYEVVKRHPVLGAEILRSIPDLGQVETTVRHHHERLDGAGYPDCLAGESIGVCARVVAVVDTFDAITTTRSYRRARTPRQALEIMGDASGAQLDGELVEHFARLWYAGDLEHIFGELWEPASEGATEEDERDAVNTAGAVGCDHGVIA
jgi:putative nucleotidyltransferase with HDIG domain